MTLLSVENISSGYGETVVVDNVSIDVQGHEIVVIIGPNGCGKSTLLKTIFGLMEPRSGKIFLNDEDITGSRPYDLVRKSIGFMPQTGNVFSELTIMENLEMGSYLLKHPDYEEIFNIFPVLRDKLRDRAHSLSGGERQMLALARALINKPKLLLLDEPSAGLAPKMVELMMEKIKEIGKRDLASVLLVEQNAKSALAIADRGYIMVMGKIVFQGRSQDILDHKEIGRLYLGKK